MRIRGRMRLVERVLDRARRRSAIRVLAEGAPPPDRPFWDRLERELRTRPGARVAVLSSDPELAVRLRAAAPAATVTSSSPTIDPAQRQVVFAAAGPFDLLVLDRDAGDVGVDRGQLLHRVRHHLVPGGSASSGRPVLTPRTAPWTRSSSWPG